MNGVVADLKHAIRLLSGSPGFTAIILLVLALGIGGNSAIFSVVNAVLLQPLDYPDSGQLAQIGRQLPAGFSNAQTILQFAYFRDRNHSFSGMATYDGRGGGMNLSEGGEPERIPSIRVSSEFFEVLQSPPQLGRDFTSADGLPGAEKVAIISDGLWQRRFGGDRRVVGRSLRLSGQSYTVVGVMRRGFRFVNPADVWTPLTVVADPNDRSAVFYIVARLKPGVTVAAAQSDMDGVAEGFRREYPDVMQARERAIVRPFSEQVIGDIRPALWILLGAVALVLLIACANVANMLLARATGRSRELAVRAALGAGRLRIARQLVVESLLLAVLGGALGLLLARGCIDFLLGLRPANLPRLDEIVVDRTVLLFTLGLSLLTGFLFGLFPALQSSRIDMVEAMKEGAGRLSAGMRRGFARAALVVFEVAVASILLVGAALLIVSFSRMRELDPGFDANNILTMKMSFGNPRQLTTARFTAFTEEVVRRLKAVPGIDSAATISTLPLEHGLMLFFDVEGRPRDPKERAGRAQWRLITPEYFRAMGIPLLQGRGFTERDTVDSPPVVIINRALARQYFQQENPIGKGLLGGNPGSQEPALEIVGVADDIRELALDRPPTPTVFAAASQAPDTTTAFLASILPTCWVVRTEGDPLEWSGAVRREILSVDRDQPVSDIRAMEEVLSQSAARREFNTLLIGAFAGLAILLAAAGIYGVTSYSVEQRTHEIGIRIALGAERRETLRLVLRRSLMLTAAGVLIGLAGALALTRVLSTLLFGVSATDPATFVFTAALIAAVSLLASYVPARRATRVDPVLALRRE